MKCSRLSGRHSWAETPESIADPALRVCSRCGARARIDGQGRTVALPAAPADPRLPVPRFTATFVSYGSGTRPLRKVATCSDCGEKGHRAPQCPNPQLEAER